MYFGCRFVLGVVSSEQTGTYISVGSEVYTVWGLKRLKEISFRKLMKCV